MRMQTNAVKHIILIDTVKGLPIYDSGSNNLLLTAEITHGDGDTWRSRMTVNEKTQKLGSLSALNFFLMLFINSGVSSVKKCD